MKKMLKNKEEDDDEEAHAGFADALEQERSEWSCVSPKARRSKGSAGVKVRRNMMSESHTTTDHDTIRKWATERKGRPATVAATEEGDHAGILRIEFGPKNERLDEIDWDEFFEKFDESDLAFLYQERTKDGKISRFHKFVRRSYH
jgi:hypothetical protein